MNLAAESSYNLKKSANGTFSNSLNSSVAGNRAAVMTGTYFYGSLHNHTALGEPIYSWRDMFSLQQFYQNCTANNTGEVTIILIVKEGGVLKTYALKIDDFTVLGTALNNDVIANIPDFATKTQDEILDEMDKKLGKKYSESLDLAPTFLKRFNNFGVSLYQANANLTNWSKLELIDPNAANPTMFANPCN